LRIEFFARDEIELREALRKHRFDVALNVFGWRVLQQIAHAILKILKEIIRLLHGIPLRCTKNVQLLSRLALTAHARPNLVREPHALVPP
jgi:hypothetical protein